jgi:hypothetical protein
MPKTKRQDVELQVQVQFKDRSDGNLEQLAGELHNEMRDLHVEVTPVKGGKAPSGSKSVELAVIGAWIVKMAPAVLPSLLSLLKDWTKRQPASPLKVTVKRGAKAVTIEYDPRKASLADVEAMVGRLLNTK